MVYKVGYGLEVRNHNKGYLVIRNQTRDRKVIFEHTLVAEKALGKPLPPGACVHHADGDKKNNRSSNLVICPDVKYHRFLHKRMRAKKISGKAWYLICVYCNKYDDPKNLLLNDRAHDRYCHRQCRQEYTKNSYQRWKAKHRSKQ